MSRTEVAYHLRRSLFPPQLKGFPEGYQVLYAPQPDL